MANFKFAGIELSDTINSLFSGKLGSAITDIYVQPGQPFRARIASQDWVVIEDPDSPEGKPIVYDEARFNAAMAMFFSTNGETPNREWKEVVTEAGECAYPVFEMPVEVIDTGDDGKAVTTTKDYRIRGTLQKQNSGSYGLMLRCLREVPQSLESVGLPQEIEQLVELRSGLIIITGPTGAGKSTTIAAMVNHLNQTKHANIVLIEDPVEYRHVNNKSYIITREIGVDVKSYEKGVQQVLRFVPDVIGIGEIRDPETMRAAVRAGESGHLVIATLHAPTVEGAVRKALGYLSTPGEQMAFAGCLKAVLAQALIPTRDGGKALAFELLDCREDGADNGRMSIQSVISDVAAGKGEGQFVKFSTSFRAGSAGGILSSHFSNSLKQLVESKKVEAKRAIPVASDRETIRELQAIARA